MMIDPLINTLDSALRTIFAPAQASRNCPTLPEGATVLTDDEKAHAAGLMRVNHVGEVCAQALYRAQAAATQDAGLRAQFLQAAQEETDHLAWTQARLDELGARPSLLNPLWYAGSFALGLAAARAGDRMSLGFVVETERQVEAHLESHLLGNEQALPANDHASRAIVAQMKDDEAAHAEQALAAGAMELPAPVKMLMRGMAKLMTRTAYRI
jgi:3-demethoxyubiquinol 3-hydroxylase